jgi:hypothetical protein
MNKIQQAYERAKAEIEQENYLKEVERFKIQLREQSKKSIWQKLFPWKIKIERR